MPEEIKPIICPVCNHLLDVVVEVYNGRTISKQNSNGKFVLEKNSDDVFLECGYCGVKLPEPIQLMLEPLLPVLK